MRNALDTIAKLVNPALTATTMPWHLVEHHHVAAIRARLAETYAPANTNKMLSALKGTLRAAFNLGFMTADQLTRAISVRAIRGSRVPRGRSLNQGEIRALFGVCDSKTPAGARNAAALTLMYAGALRRSEVVGLDLADVDLATGRLHVRGKGDKERVLFVVNGGLKAIEAWLRYRGNHAGALIHPILKGGRIVPRRMNDHSILDLVLQLATKAGVDRFSPHTLRKTAVGDLLDNGVDLGTVAKIAGHASPVTTSNAYDRRGERVKLKAAEALHVPFA